jgi:hypothetical protein
MEASLMTLGSSIRYVGIAGILSAVLLTAGGIVLAPLPDDLSSPATKFATVVINNRGALRSGDLFLLVAIVPLILFAGGILEVLNQDVNLSRVLRRAAFGFAITTAAMFAVSYGVAAAVAITAQDTAPDTVRIVYGVSGSASVVGSLFLGLFILTTSVLALLVHSMPRWVRYLGLASGLCLAIGSFALVAGAGFLALFYLIGWYLSQAWFSVAGVSILIGRFSGQPEPTVRSSGPKPSAEPASLSVGGRV